METLGDCQDCIHFLLQLFENDAMGLLLGFTDRKTTGIRTHTYSESRVVGETRHDRHPELFHQTVSMPPSEVILQLRRKKNTKHFMKFLCAQSRTEQNPIHRPLSRRPHKRSLSRRVDALWCLIKTEFDRSALPNKSGRAEEVIMRSSRLTDRLWCHLADWRFSLECVSCRFWVGTRACLAARLHAH